VLTIDRVIQGKGRLLHYYFGQGRRTVHLEEGDFLLTGTLATKWLEAERLWMISLARPGSPILPAIRRTIPQFRQAS
jgi:hypothetical protein